MQRPVPAVFTARASHGSARVVAGRRSHGAIARATGRPRVGVGLGAAAEQANPLAALDAIPGHQVSCAF
jgi:hypothetical protein